MENYYPPFSITNKMLRYVSEICEKIERLNIDRNMSQKPRLRKNNKIESIHSSLKIEANSLTLGQVKDVIDGHYVLGERKEIQEVKNAYEAYEHISDINPYSLSTLMEIHSIMMKYLVEESGCFRSGEEGVFSGETCVFMAPPAKLVPKLTEDLFKWLNQEKDNIHPLILSAVFHYEFVFIHPFTDGNGRMARLWHTVLLSKWKPVLEFVPLESQIEKFQDGYYDSIAKSHSEGNSNPFIEFVLEQLNEVLAEILNTPNTSELSDYTKRMLSVMERGEAYTSFEIMEKLGLKSKETFRKNYLNPALDKELIVMTIPDKPRSKNQKYIKT